ncbi:MAG: hypothetical protein EOO90_23385 [Pedobacter sp.]|nr:MAG: hypothetical protein EOO90_23385 [Pedobacter sp.]
MNHLLFLYIEDYEDFGAISINFSNSFEISYFDEELSVTRKNNLVHDLYGENIIDINIIAGQNGIGKTTLLKVIADITCEKDRYSDSYNYKYIQIIRTGEETGVIYTSLQEDRLLNVDSANLELELEAGLTYEPGRPIVYYSPFLDFNLLEVYSEVKTQPIIDLSQTQIMMDDMEEKDRDVDEEDFVEPYSLLSHKLSNIKRHLSFVKQNRENFILPFPLPSTFWLNFHRLQAKKDDLSQQDNEIYEELQAFCAEYFRGFPENGISKATMAYLMFLRNLLTMFFKSVNNIKTPEILHHQLRNFSIEEVTSFENNDPDKLIALIVKFFQNQDVFKSNIFINLIEVVFQIINSENVNFRNANNLLSVELDLSSQSIDRVFSILSDAQQNSDNKQILSPLTAFISFDWSNLSSGEKMFLDLFSRLQTLASRLTTIKEPILMMIDEGEMGFHPSWQLKYVETLKVFFNTFFPLNNFQILLATHSPLVLSDFPRERAHLIRRNLETREREKLNSIGTFAQSTSELLANEFFIETSLLGNLAKKYIDDIILSIAHLVVGSVMPKDALAIYERIALIDEPIIKQLLVNELERKANA